MQVCRYLYQQGRVRVISLSRNAKLWQEGANGECEYVKYRHNEAVTPTGEPAIREKEEGE
jgi:hypothetical protein